MVLWWYWVSSVSVVVSSVAMVSVRLDCRSFIFICICARFFFCSWVWVFSSSVRSSVFCSVQVFLVREFVIGGVLCGFVVFGC